MTDTTRTRPSQSSSELRSDSGQRMTYDTLQKPIAHETLLVPTAAIEIKRQVRNGELDGFEIEKIVVAAHTTDDTKQALLNRDDSPAQPFAPLTLTEVKCKTASELSLPSYRSKQAVNKYKSLLLPKSTIKKRVSVKAPKKRRGRVRNKKSLLPPTKTLRKDPRAKR